MCLYPALEIIVFHYVYCMHQISDTVCTGNLDVYRLFQSHEIYLLESKTNYVDFIYLLSDLFMYTEPYSLYKILIF